MAIPPILDNKQTSMPSAFAPAALLREARRQKGIAAVAVPSVCILDPDGNLVRQLRRVFRCDRGDYRVLTTNAHGLRVHRASDIPHAL